jgi:3-dehydroquinate dehydratase II
VQVVVLNGVNLDVLARRDASLCGGLSLDELETRIYEWASQLGCQVRCRQTNNEGEYVEWCHDALDGVDGVIVNPGAWSHYSYAIHDALELLQVPIVEVHLSDVDAREDWRRNSVISDLAAKRIVGKGPDGYREALEFIVAKRGER